MKILKNRDRQAEAVLKLITIFNLFLIDSKGNFIFRRTRFKGYSAQQLYKESPGLFIEFLHELWYQVNIIDKSNIDRLIKILENPNEKY